VHSPAPKPEPLVEPLLGALRQLDDDESVEDGALRRRAARVQLELGRFADTAAPELPDLSLAPYGEASGDRLGGDDDDRSTRQSYLGQQHAVVERLEPMAPPPPPETGEARHQQPEPVGRQKRGGNAERRDGGRTPGKRVQPTEVGKRDPGREREGEKVRRCRPDDHDGITSPRRLSIRDGPIPGIASRSSTDVNGPCSVL